MLFPLNYQCETESNIDDTGEFDGEGTLEHIQDDVHMSALEDQPVYRGPQTQSHAKALMKTNLIMNKYFQIDNMLCRALLQLFMVCRVRQRVRFKYMYIYCIWWSLVCCNHTSKIQ